jgi:hypothetical protein
VRIRESHPLLHKPIEVRRREVIAGIKCMNIAHAKVVRQNDNDVGRLAVYGNNG